MHQHRHEMNGSCGCESCGAEQMKRRLAIEKEYAGLFLGGPLEYSSLSRTLLSKLSFAAAADGGMNHLFKLQQKPQLMVGDLDSVSPEALAFAEKEGVIIEKFPREKDQTDGELAVDRLLMEGFTKLILFGAFGGARLDHSLSMLLYCLELKKRFGLEFILTDGTRLIYLLQGPEDRTFDISPYFTQEQYSKLRISGIPLSKICDLHLENLKYPLSGSDVEPGSTLLVSNEPEENGQFNISFKSGSLVLFIGEEI